MLQPETGAGVAADASDLDTEIAVIGMSCRFPEAPDLSRYWANLRDGRESITRYSDEELIAAGVDARAVAHPDYVKAGAPLPDMEMFDATLFGLSARDAAIMDPQHRHFLQCAWAALEDAGHVPERFGGAIGVFAGSGHNAYMPYNLLTNPELVRKVGFFLMRHTGNDKDFLSTRVSYLLDLKGPSVNVQTACSTSLVAIHMAVQSLLNGESDMALAGGVTIELPHRHGYRFEPGEILSPDGHCRAFDAAAAGTVFGSGVGVVALRRLRDAIEDGDHIYAVIKSSAVNNDGLGKVSYLAPSVDGQARAIAEALSIANVDARSISYVETHGTGTPVGDPIEIAALTQAFRRDTDAVGFCAIGSVKPNIGHTDTAAGVASFIKVALALMHRELPPSLNHSASNPACGFDRSPFFVNDRRRRWDASPGSPRRAGVSSLGVGGTNCHVVLQEAPSPEPSGPSRAHQLLIQSAASQSALDANALALADHLDQHAEQPLADMAFTLQTGRKALPYRRIVVAASHASAAAALTDTSSPAAFTQHCTAIDRKVAFLFAGGGAQYAGMARGLYESEPVFRGAVDECLDILAGLTPTEFRGALFPAAGSDAVARAALERPSTGLPALFVIQYAVARLWMAWGVEPDAMIGHSMGEYVAAHLAGVFDLRSALRLAWGRGQLFETLPPGRMLSVPLSEEALRPYIGPELSIAAINGAALTVASGSTEAIDRLRQALDEDGIVTQPVAISVAAHSHMLDPILDAFRALVSDVRMQPPTRPFVSCLTGDWARAEDVTRTDYWVRHLRETVRFDAGLARLLPSGHLLLEVGPGRTLASLARQHRARGQDQHVFNSLRHADEVVDDLAYILKILGSLWASGLAVRWERFWLNERRRRVALPSYRFDRQRHWIEPGAAADRDAGSETDLVRHPDQDNWFYQPIWRRAALGAPVAPAAAALVFLDDEGAGDAIVARLQRQGCLVTSVRAGPRFRINGPDSLTINAANAGDYARLVDHLSKNDRLPAQIYHLWLVEEEQGAAQSRRATDHALERGFWSLFHLARALGEAGVDQEMTIAVVSTGMQRVCNEPTTVAARAAALGPCRVIPSEYPHMRICSVDVEMPESPRAGEDLAQAIIGELSAPEPTPTVAYRRRERWVQEFEPLRLCSSDQSRLRPGGTYLIIGGLGGIGLHLAEHLFETLGARLALVSRSGLPPRSEWATLLAMRSPGDAVSRRIRQIQALEARGAEILVADADICDVRAMRRAVARIRARFGAIHGVFHAAGILDDGLIPLKSPGSAAAVLAPKIYGTLALEAALDGERPDFLMLFSSVSTIAGIAGQVDYAAANAFLDAYAQQRSAEGGTSVVAVGWPRWQEVGMAASPGAALQQPRARHAPDTGQPVQHPFLDRLIAETRSRRIYAARLAPKTHWLLDEHRLRSGEALIPGAGLVEIVRGAFRDIARNRPIELREMVFLAPFAVGDDAARDLHVDLHHEGGEAWRFHIMGRDSDADEHLAWMEHARGYAMVGTPDDAKRLDWEAIVARCLVNALAAQRDSSAHLTFGPRWQNIEMLHVGKGEAVIELCLPEHCRNDLQHIALHPALLDFATAGAQLLIPGFDGETQFYAPASYARLKLSAPLPARIISHVRFRADEAQPGELATFDITIASPQGQVLAEIEGFTMIRVHDARVLGGGDRHGDGRTSPASMTQPALEDGAIQGLSSLDGMDVIERILASRDSAQIVVSPQSLMPMLAHLRVPTGVRRPQSRPADDLPAEDLPQTEAERVIAGIWQDMLGTPAIRRTDDFFDLGGHSLLAVQLINRLRKQFGQHLALTALVEAPTVARLAALVAPSDAAPDACEALAPGSPAPGIVLLRPGDEPGALFLVHDGLGETLLYRTLALQLDGPSVYGIQPERHPDGSFVHASIHDMARGHVERIQKIQPHGPYLLAGLCAGGVIAVEMARQLGDRGEEIGYVGIIDAADVEAVDRPFHKMRARWRRVKDALGQNGRSFGGVLALPSLLARKFRNMVAYEISARRDRRRIDHALERAPASISFLELYEAAHRRHRPEGLLHAQKVVLYKAMCGNGAMDDHPFAEQFGDHALGWGKRVADEVEVVSVPGGHSSALQEPNVGSLARAMQDALDAVLMDSRRRGGTSPVAGMALRDMADTPHGAEVAP